MEPRSIHESESAFGFKRQGEKVDWIFIVLPFSIGATGLHQWLQLPNFPNKQNRRKFMSSDKIKQIVAAGLRSGCSRFRDSGRG